MEKEAVWLEDGRVYSGNYSDSLGLKVSDEIRTQQNKLRLLFSGITMRTNMLTMDSGKSFAIQYCENTLGALVCEGFCERRDAPEMLFHKLHKPSSTCVSLC